MHTFALGSLRTGPMQNSYLVHKFAGLQTGNSLCPIISEHL